MLITDSCLGLYLSFVVLCGHSEAAFPGCCLVLAITSSLPHFYEKENHMILVNVPRLTAHLGGHGTPQWQNGYKLSSNFYDVTPLHWRFSSVF